MHRLELPSLRFLFQIDALPCCLIYLSAGVSAFRNAVIPSSPQNDSGIVFALCTQEYFKKTPETQILKSHITAC